MTTWVSRHWRLAIVWALSLLVTGALTAAAQPDFLMTEQPTIVSGADLGFRVERTRDGMAIGRVVVRINGRWIDTGSATTVVPSR